MMTSAIASLMVAALIGQTDVTGLVGEIQQKNFNTIAVCPRPIVLQGEQQTSIDDISLLAAQQIDEITRSLVEQAGGQFTIVDSTTSLNAIKGMTIDDLNNEQVRAGIGQRTGAQAMLFVFAEQNRATKQWDLFWKLIELGGIPNNFESPKETFDLVLSDAAYMGESFEARRWGPDGLENAGFPDTMPREQLMGVGPEWERLQYAGLQQVKAAMEDSGIPFPHPLENANVPYGIELIVDGQPAVPERICDKLYVAIDPSAQPGAPAPDIGIRMFNGSGRPVMMGIYIDGVTMINQQRQLPLMTPVEHHWYVRDGYNATLKDWFSMVPGQPATRAKLELVDAQRAVAPQRPLPAGGENLVAFGDRIDDRLGQITCLVYTYTWQDVDANFSPPRVRGLGGRFAMGAGARQQAQLQWKQGNRGILLAAMTLHYATTNELNQIRVMGCEPLPPAAPAQQP